MAIHIQGACCAHENGVGVNPGEEFLFIIQGEDGHGRTIAAIRLGEFLGGKILSNKNEHSRARMHFPITRLVQLIAGQFGFARMPVSLEFGTYLIGFDFETLVFIAAFSAPANK